MAWYDSFDAMVSADLSSSFFDTDEFAESVTRTPATGSPATVTARWKELEPERDLTTGERIARHGILNVLSSQTVALTDQWTINSEVWQTEHLGAVNDGTRMLHLKKTTKITTREPARVLL